MQVRAQFCGLTADRPTDQTFKVFFPFVCFFGFPSFIRSFFVCCPNFAVCVFVCLFFGCSFFYVFFFFFLLREFNYLFKKQVQNQQCKRCISCCWSCCCFNAQLYKPCGSRMNHKKVIRKIPGLSFQYLPCVHIL